MVAVAQALWPLLKDQKLESLFGQVTVTVAVENLH